MAQFEAVRRMQHVLRLAAQAERLAREAALTLIKVQVVLADSAGMTKAEIETMERHRVSAAAHLAQAMAVAVSLEMAIEKLREIQATVSAAANGTTLQDQVA